MVSVSQIWSKSFPTIFLHVFKESLVWVLALVTSWLVLCWWFLGSSKSVLVAAVTVLVSSAVIVREMSRQKTLVVDSGGVVEDEGCPSPLSSGSECINPSVSEDSEAETDQGRGREWSEDGSITDEESLIEIEIPSGHYIGCGRKEEVLEIGDVNEEENLIEIDISMGSIKCTKGYELNR